MHDLWIRIPRFDSAFVRLALEILLTLLMHERGAKDGPQPAFRGETHDFGRGDAERRCGVYGEVGEEVEQADVVRAEVEVGDGDGVGAWVVVGFLRRTSVDECGCVVFFGERCVVGVELAFVR